MRFRFWERTILGAAITATGWLGLGSAFAQGPYSSPPWKAGGQPHCPAPIVVPSERPPVAVEPKPAPVTPDKPTTPDKPPTTEPAPPSPDTFQPPDSTADTSGEGLTLFDSSVGYIDNAIPMNLLRLRFDSAWFSNRPSRAEFFYPKGGPGGRGLPLVETSLDHQEFFAYAEALMGEQFSVFIESPVRWVNPEVNDNHAGWGDMNFGFKYAFLSSESTVASFQFRTWVPTGDAGRGLGTDHVSLAPAVLLFHKVSDFLRLEAELHDWIPIGGTDFQGNVIRYGIGFSAGERSQEDMWINPVVEFVGWTCLNGKELVAGPAVPTLVGGAILPRVLTSQVKDSAGATIVNAKLGLRIGFGDRFDFYGGYGWALTGDVWYKDIARFEMRLHF